MKFRDVETEYTKIEELTQGTILNYFGDFVMITDVKCEFSEDICIIYLENGRSEYLNKVRLLSYTNDRDEDIRAVSDSVLQIKGYV